MKKGKRENNATAVERKVMNRDAIRARDRKVTKARGLAPKGTTDNSLTPRRGEKTAYRAAFDLAKKEGRTENVAKLLWKSAANGDGRAMYALATWYVHGIIYKIEPKKAVGLLKKAAKKNIRDAMFDLATSYETGFGVKKDASKAFDLFVAAAQRGDKTAREEVVRHLFYGIGFKKHKELAFLIRMLPRQS